MLYKAPILKNQPTMALSYTERPDAYIVVLCGIFAPKLISKFIFVTMPPLGFEN